MWHNRESKLAKLVLTQSGAGGIQISLSTGQSCTIGSSAAADYSLPSDELDEIHCRFTCRRNSSFIECLNHQSKIIINDKDANRSSLSDGDSIRLGPFVLSVDFESARAKTQSFEPADEMEQFDTLNEVDSLVELSPISESEFGDLQESNTTEPEPIDALEDEVPGFAFQEQSFDFNEDEEEELHPTEVAESTTDLEMDMPPEMRPSDASVATGIEANVVVEEGAGELSTESREHSTTVAGIELDEFDSTNESTLPDIRDGSSWKNEEESDPPISKSTDPKASEFLRSLVNRSVLEKKSGEEALDFLKLLIEQGAKVFQLQHRVLHEIEFSDVTKVDAEDDMVFVVSKLDSKELQTTLDEKKWLARMRYPHGLQRFLELSPKVCAAFFTVMSACLFFDAAANEHELIHSADSSA